MKTQIEKLEDVTNIAVANGNYDCNAYMHGMANGLLLAKAIMKDEEVVYLDAPKEWLDNRPSIVGDPVSASGLEH